jgi:hypothetical protein
MLKRELANENSNSNLLFTYFAFHKKWPLHLLTTTTMAFLLPLFSSGTRSATLFLDTIVFLKTSGTSLWPFSLPRLASIQDARWLTEVCAGKDVNTVQDAKRVLFALGQKDARALCFAWLCCDWDEQEDLTALRRSAELGFAFAQAWLAGQTEGEEKFKFAQLAAAQGERDGCLAWVLFS